MDFSLPNSEWDSSPYQDNFIDKYFGAKLSNGKGEIYIQSSNSHFKRKSSNVENHDKKNCDKIKNSDINCDLDNFPKDIQMVKKRKHPKQKELKRNDSNSHSDSKEFRITDTETVKSQSSSKAKRIKGKQYSISEESSNNESLKYPTSTLKTSTMEDMSDLHFKVKCTPLQNKAYEKLQAAKFRFINELFYTNSGKEAMKYFKENEDDFLKYHYGFQQQASKWPINPVEVIIKELKSENSSSVIADMGCGEAKIAQRFPNRTVYSFDLVALNSYVTACDIARVPLEKETTDIVIFCLSLMGTNLAEFIKEAFRILKNGGLLKIAEIESRIEDLTIFVKNIEQFGFSLQHKNVSHKLFVFLDFKKVTSKVKSKVSNFTLKPCMYKKR